MPSKHTFTAEHCYPCKYWRQTLWKSGLHPVYQRFCQHPSQLDSSSRFRPDEGRFISDSSDERPDWCPLRGNPRAEQEAMNDAD